MKKKLTKMDGTNPNLVVNDMDRHVESDGLTHLMKSSSTASSRSGGGRSGGPLPVSSVNHLSLLCSSVEKSLSFYKDILGFIPVKRPGALGSRGAWYVSKDLCLYFERLIMIHHRSKLFYNLEFISFQLEFFQSITWIDSMI